MKQGENRCFSVSGKQQSLLVVCERRKIESHISCLVDLCNIIVHDLLHDEV